MRYILNRPQFYVFICADNRNIPPNCYVLHVQVCGCGGVVGVQVRMRVEWLSYLLHTTLFSYISATEDKKQYEDNIPFYLGEWSGSITSTMVRTNEK